MRRALEQLNRNRREKKLFEIENGIGIVSGRAFSAVAGANTGRKVFTVIGSVVNQAEALEAETAKIGGSRILVCMKTAENCHSKIGFLNVPLVSQALLVEGIPENE
jgi:class 3 adenylate cyclase